METTKQVTVRAEVRDFALHMEERLRRHDADFGPTGWREAPQAYLLKRLLEETAELLEALYLGVNVEGEAADVANISMMIADKAKQERR